MYPHLWSWTQDAREGDQRLTHTSLELETVTKTFSEIRECLLGNCFSILRKLQKSNLLKRRRNNCFKNQEFRKHIKYIPDYLERNAFVHGMHGNAFVKMPPFPSHQEAKKNSFFMLRTSFNGRPYDEI